MLYRSHNNLSANQKASSFCSRDKMKGPGDQQSRTLKLDHTVLSFSLPMLFSNCFSMELSKFEVNIERNGEKDCPAQHVNVIPSLNWTDPSSNVTAIVAIFVIIKRSRTLIKLELGTIYVGLKELLKPERFPLDRWKHCEFLLIQNLFRPAITSVFKAGQWKDLTDKIDIKHE